LDSAYDQAKDWKIKSTTRRGIESAFAVETPKSKPKSSGGGASPPAGGSPPGGKKKKKLANRIKAVRDRIAARRGEGICTRELLQSRQDGPSHQGLP
jgi:hypothetical protein